MAAVIDSGPSIHKSFRRLDAQSFVLDLLDRAGGDLESGSGRPETSLSLSIPGRRSRMDVAEDPRAIYFRHPSFFFKHFIDRVTERVEAQTFALQAESPERLAEATADLRPPFIVLRRASL